MKPQFLLVHAKRPSTIVPFFWVGPRVGMEAELSHRLLRRARYGAAGVDDIDASPRRPSKDDTKDSDTDSSSAHDNAGPQDGGDAPLGPVCPPRLPSRVEGDECQWGAGYNELPESVYNRVNYAMRRIQCAVQRSRKVPIVVAHGGVIKEFLRQWGVGHVEPANLTVLGLRVAGARVEVSNLAPGAESSAQAPGARGKTPLKREKIGEFLGNEKGMRFVLIRHAESVNNKVNSKLSVRGVKTPIPKFSDVVRGIASGAVSNPRDSKLYDVEQTKMIGKKIHDAIDHHKVQYFVSPMYRTLQTALAIACPTGEIATLASHHKDTRELYVLQDLQEVRKSISDDVNTTEWGIARRNELLEEYQNQFKLEIHWNGLPLPKPQNVAELRATLGQLLGKPAPATVRICGEHKTEEGTTCFMVDFGGQPRQFLGTALNTALKNAIRNPLRGASSHITLRTAEIKKIDLLSDEWLLSDLFQDGMDSFVTYLNGRMTMTTPDITPPLALSYFEMHAAVVYQYKRLLVACAQPPGMEGVVNPILTSGFDKLPNTRARYLIVLRDIFKTATESEQPGRRIRRFTISWRPLCQILEAVCLGLYNWHHKQEQTITNTYSKLLEKLEKRSQQEQQESLSLPDGTAEHDKIDNYIDRYVNFDQNPLSKSFRPTPSIPIV